MRNREIWKGLSEPWCINVKHALAWVVEKYGKGILNPEVQFICVGLSSKEVWKGQCKPCKTMEEKFQTFGYLVYFFCIAAMAGQSVTIHYLWMTPVNLSGYSFHPTLVHHGNQLWWWYCVWKYWNISSTRRKFLNSRSVVRHGNRNLTLNNSKKLWAICPEIQC